jgi:gamma-glutamylcysteine synthetase
MASSLYRHALRSREGEKKMKSGIHYNNAQVMPDLFLFV